MRDNQPLAPWPGIANGDEFTIEQKAEARAHADLPEDHERVIAAKLGPLGPAYIKTHWRAGHIDLHTYDLEEGGQDGAISMTEQQREWWLSPASAEFTARIQRRGDRWEKTR